MGVMLPLVCALVRNRFVQHMALWMARVLGGASRKVAPDGSLQTLGSERTARNVARRAERSVAAYRDFAGRHRQDGAAQGAPVLDKGGYILRYPMSQLLADDWKDTFTIFRSSGSSGSPQYWPQLKQTHRLQKWAFRLHLEHCFEIHRRRSIAIVGLSLGSWAGGDYVSWLLKSLAMDANYPFCVFTPGNRHDEILEMNRDLDSILFS